MKRLWHLHPWLVAAFALALGLSVFFAGRLVWSTIYWAGHRQEAVAPWMTVGYVGRSWQLDPREIDARAGLPLPGGHPQTLQDIADARGVRASEIVALVEAAVAALRAEKAKSPSQAEKAKSP